VDGRLADLRALEGLAADRHQVFSLDQALRYGFTRDMQYDRRASGHWVEPGRRGKGYRGSAAMAELIARHGSVVADSGWEIRLAELLVDGGLPEPSRQLQIRTVSGTRRVDLAYPGTPVIGMVPIPRHVNRYAGGIARWRR
jgi:hypothetical protein